MSNESKALSDRDRAIQWLRDDYDEAPPEKLIWACIDLLKEIVEDTASNAFETTPQLYAAVKTLYEMQRNAKGGGVQEVFDLRWAVVQLRDAALERVLNPVT
jgi:hypothetical protein